MYALDPVHGTLFFSFFFVASRIYRPSRYVGR